MTDEDAAFVLVLKVDGEVRNLPQGLDTVPTEHDLRILDAEAREIGGVAASCPLEDIGDGPRHVELAPGGCRRWRLRAFGDDALRRNARLRGGAAGAISGTVPLTNFSTSLLDGR